MEDLVELSDQIDKQIIKSRLNAIALLTMVDRTKRVESIAEALRALGTGAYLLGTGPSTCGIYPLSVDEVILGRPATPAEEAPDVAVDFLVADAVYFKPQEVSRAHAKIVRRESDGNVRYLVFDLNSTCGTSVNGQIAGGSANGRVLTSGDTISLGSGNVSTYVFFEKRQAED